jgi:hypothetical protein
VRKISNDQPTNKRVTATFLRRRAAAAVPVRGWSGVLISRTLARQLADDLERLADLIGGSTPKDD